MNFFRLHISVWKVCAAVIALAGAAAGETGKVQIVCRDDWSNVFGDRDVELRLKVKSGEAFQGLAMVEWSAGRQAFTRREYAVSAGPRNDAELAISARIPAVRPGVRFPVAVSVAVVPAGSREPIATWRRELMAFSEDPFVTKRAWIKGLKIEVWDPENKTTDLLEKAKLEYHRAGDLEAALGVSNTVVVGEGVPPDHYPVLFRSLVEAASHGSRILCLAPAVGDLSQVPGAAGTTLPTPRAMIFRGADIITELDKKLDDVGWPPDGLAGAIRFQAHADRGQAALKTTTAGPGWPWLEMRFEGGGRLFFCGFPIVTRWNETPTPRYLFVRLLEALVEQNGSRSDAAPQAQIRDEKGAIKDF